MELLPPGEVLLERARTALAFLDRTVDDVRGLRKREGGPAPGS